MKIESIQIKNFKKLKNVSIKLSEEQNIFVGANNSGKTSAMEAITKFLKRSSYIDVYDFTIYNWLEINEKLEELNSIEKIDSQEENFKKIIENKKKIKNDLNELFPSLKVTISVDESELHKVIEIIPGLKDEIKNVSVYFRFEPENYELLFKDYFKARERINMMTVLANDNPTHPNLNKVIDNQWPMSFQDFLKGGQLKKYFKIKAYLANPNNQENEFPFDDSTFIKGNPLENIIKVDEINAQRGLSDKETDENFSKSKKLSRQFTKYYNDFEMQNEVNIDELNLLKANHRAEDIIRKQLEKHMELLIKPLAEFGYPGFGSPDIKVSPIIDVSDTMNNESSILFNTQSTDSSDEHYLPENYNGLGFQNLISIFFELSYFKKERISKQSKEGVLEPLHLVLIEEPEAHLHAQAQKVFIEKALNILVEDQDDNLYTQLVMSTHSSHIADHAGFNDLLYFKRKKNKKSSLHEVEVINLEEINLDPDDKGKDTNKRFVERYLQLADHDIFFADGIILIEGASERILLPQMIKNCCPMLSNKYLTIMEVGGAYAHKFYPLLEKLDRPTLIITDIDSVQSNDKGSRIKVHSTNSDKKFTSNGTIKKWFGNDPSIKSLLKNTELQKEKKHLKIVYQTTNHANSSRSSAYSRTFEDDFAMTNIDFFKMMDKPLGLSKKFQDIFIQNSKIDTKVVKKLFEEIDKTKTQFALDVLFEEVDTNKQFKTPKYILDGLIWLQSKLDEEVLGGNTK